MLIRMCVVAVITIKIFVLVLVGAAEIMYQASSKHEIEIDFIRKERRVN